MMNEAGMCRLCLYRYMQWVQSVTVFVEIGEVGIEKENSWLAWQGSL
jgi:hypothetical protein